MNALVVSTHIQHRFEDIFGVTSVAALAPKSCDTPSLHGNDLITLRNVRGSEGKFPQEVITRGHNITDSREYAIRAQRSFQAAPIMERTSLFFISIEERNSSRSENS